MSVRSSDIRKRSLQSVEYRIKVRQTVNITKQSFWLEKDKTTWGKMAITFHAYNHKVIHFNSFLPVLLSGLKLFDLTKRKETELLAWDRSFWLLDFILRIPYQSKRVKLIIHSPNSRYCYRRFSDFWYLIIAVTLNATVPASGCLPTSIDRIF